MKGWDWALDFAPGNSETLDADTFSVIQVHNWCDFFQCVKAVRSFVVYLGSRKMKLFKGCCVVSDITWKSDVGACSEVEVSWYCSTLELDLCVPMSIFSLKITPDRSTHSHNWSKPCFAGLVAELNLNTAFPQVLLSYCGRIKAHLIAHFVTTAAVLVLPSCVVHKICFLFSDTWESQEFTFFRCSHSWLSISMLVWNL